MAFPYTDISLSSVYDITPPAWRRGESQRRHGEGDSYYVQLQQPKAVPLEVSFEGLYPVERRGVNVELDSEKSVSFTGKGVVLMGQVTQKVAGGDPSYTAQIGSIHRRSESGNVRDALQFHGP